MDKRLGEYRRDIWYKEQERERLLYQIMEQIKKDVSRQIATIETDTAIDTLIDVAVLFDKPVPNSTKVFVTDKARGIPR